MFQRELYSIFFIPAVRTSETPQQNLNVSLHDFQLPALPELCKNFSTLDLLPDQLHIFLDFCLLPESSGLISTWNQFFFKYNCGPTLHHHITYMLCGGCIDSSHCVNDEIKPTIYAVGKHSFWLCSLFRAPLKFPLMQPSGDLSNK